MPGQPAHYATSWHRDDATTITQWSLHTVPALLRTPDYTEGLSRLSGRPTEEIPLRRRRKFGKQALSYVAYIGEPALWTLSRNTNVYRDQLGELLRRSTTMTLRIVPHDDCRIPALTAWTLYDYPQREMLVHTELLDSSVYLFAEEAEPYDQARARLANIALSREQSQELLGALMAQPALGPDSDGCDRPPTDPSHPSHAIYMQLIRGIDPSRLL